MLVGLVVFLSLPPAEPVIKDHPLSYWLDHIQSDNLETSSTEFQKALPAIDDHCIPVLIDELNWRPSPMLRRMERLSRKWVRGGLVHEPKDRGAEAALVLGWFGPRATNAIPALERLSRSPEANSEERGAAIAALILIRHDSMEPYARKSLDVFDPHKDDYLAAIFSLRTNAISVVPVFVNALQTTTNDEVKLCAASCLGSIHGRPDLSLPPLLSMLKETNSDLRSLAPIALGCFREDAKPAWNDLVPLLNDPDEDVRWTATNALYLIDPAAAQQLGIGAWRLRF